ncbi:sugar phosphate isomerase/epimerase family protein [Marinoscillum sp.]|uniref:sugar phosphate isomerase/epimerase family protein n=1 Tax=Marinoscillum sp. TaxID=2024838 RepID=UPI003BAC2503
MKLGFVTAILPELSFEEVLKVASDIGYDCVEVMCWPVGKAERRYAGVTHIDIAKLTQDSVSQIHDITSKYGVAISALGYYPNPLSPNEEESKTSVEHIYRLIDAAKVLGVNHANSFIGRDWTKSVDENWPEFLKVWKPIIAHAEKQDVKVGIENCPMSFTQDEWPGGKNLKTTPAIFRRMYEDIPSDYFGLNFDPSHFIWLQMDYVKAIREFGRKLFHMHAKDVRLDRDRLDEVGIMAHPSEYHTPKLPGMGDVNWGKFFSALTDTGYIGPVCVEVEDRAYEGSLERRIASLKQSYHYLRQFIPKD